MAPRKKPIKPPARRAKRSPAVSGKNGAAKNGKLPVLRQELASLRRQVKQLEAAHYEAEFQRERLAQLHNFSPVGCVVLNRQGAVLDLNFTAAALLCRTRQTLLNMPFAVCIERHSMGEYLDHLRRCRASRNGIATELEIRRPDGRVVPVRLISSQVPTTADAHAGFYQTVIVDTSDRTALEQSLRESEAQLRMALQCANAAHWSIELATRFLTWSPEFYQLLGLDPDKVPPSEEALLGVLHPEDRMALEKAMQALLTGRSEHFHGEYRLSHPSKERRWLGMFGRIVRRRGQNQPVRVAGIAIDISALKRSERLLQRTRNTLDLRVKTRTAELEAMTTTLGQEIIDRRRLEKQILEISEREQRRIGQDLHDGLGQQITGIIFHAHLLHKHLSKKGLPEAESAAQIVSLLDEAKVQARHVARGLQPVDPTPNGLMAGLEHFAATTSELFQIDCRFLCPDPVFVPEYTTATHLFRIAQEAVANAFRHGGARMIEIHLRKLDDHIVLEVLDDGSGISKTPRKGGLGLRFMKYRAETIGGTLDIRRRPGGGTMVQCRVRNPATKNEDNADHESIGQSKPGAAPHRASVEGLARGRSSGGARRSRPAHRAGA